MLLGIMHENYRHYDITYSLEVTGGQGSETQCSYGNEDAIDTRMWEEKKKKEQEEKGERDREGERGRRERG